MLTADALVVIDRICRFADLADPFNRAVLGDALDDAGDDEGAALVRSGAALRLQGNHDGWHVEVDAPWQESVCSVIEDAGLCYVADLLAAGRDHEALSSAVTALHVRRRARPIHAVTATERAVEALTAYTRASFVPAV